MKKVLIGLLVIAALSLVFTGCGGGGGGGGGGGSPTTGAIVHFNCVDQNGNPEGAGYTMYFTDPNGRERSGTVDGSNKLTVICDIAGPYTFTRMSYQGKTANITPPLPTFTVTAADVANKTEFWYTLVGYLDGHFEIKTDR
ncbi:hypothetical protein [Anaeroselena agilis]|uniref:Lipoprotein n=1 Tax=Anaeroselena agilis TaxID=3063788 RepID=A0ABU3P3F6_9FIRM|nr:hypothetical protein [Selenomonadales bacterium 4137-cl]